MQVVHTHRGLGRLDGDEIAVLETPFPDAGAVIAQTGSLAALHDCPVRARLPLADVTPLGPLGRVRAVWGVGLNYRSKAEHTGRALPTDPILYLSSSSSVLAPHGTVEVPPGVAEPDYEGEIAVVLGRRLDRAAPAEVWPAVAAITAANDMTARDVMRATSAPVLAKSYPGFTPLGASLCEPADFADLGAIRVRTTVNGVLHQDDTSAGMIFPVDELLSRLSWFAALEPGDVVLTGTPAGTGQDRSCFLADGDEVRVEVTGVLPLITRVVRPTAAAVPVDHELAEPVS